MNATTSTTSRRRSGLPLLAHLVRRGLVLEEGLQSLYRFLLRRPRVPAGARGFSYHRPVVARDDVGSVARRRRTAPSGQPRVSMDELGAATLHLWVQEETNLELALAAPTAVRLPQGPGTVSRIHFHADDPQGFLDEVRWHLG